jgi:hypothetical protein
MEVVKIRKLEEMKLNTTNLQKTDSTVAPVRAESPRRDRAYSDLPGLRHETKDVLQQLQANINSLEDLGGRLSFMLAEVRGLIRR